MSTTPADGLYAIVSALSTSSEVLCMDVCGASDDSGANVQLYTRNGSDAQIWCVTTPDSSAPAKRQVLCSLSGGSLDVESGHVGTSGTNVQQYADNDTDAQRWTFAADGSTATVGGTSYPTYVVSPYGAATACDAAGGGTTPGTNVQLWAKNGSAAQRWCLVPVAALSAGGTFRLVSALDETNLAVADVAGGSTADGANVQLWGANGSDAQVWRASVDRQTRLATISNAGSGKVLDVVAAGTSDGTNVQQWATNGTRAQRWLAEQSGTMRVNGASVPTYVLHSENGNGKVLDAAGGRLDGRLSTNLQIWSANDTKAQRFALVPTEALGDTLPMPSDLRLSTSTDDAGGSSRWANSGMWPRLYVSFYDPNGSAWQARYRMRTRRVGGSLGAWGPWLNLGSHHGGNSGWGDVQHATAGMSKVGSRIFCSAAIASPVDGSTCDYAEVEAQVRELSQSWGAAGAVAHGAGADMVLRMTWMPTVALSGVSLGVGGLVVGIASDYRRGGNTAVISIWDSTKSRRLCSGVKVTGLDWTDGATVPWSSLAIVPDVGDQLSVDITWSTDVVSRTQAGLSAAVGESAGRGMTLAPVVTEPSWMPGALCRRVRVPVACDATCHVMVSDGHSTRFEACRGWKDAQGCPNFQVYPPLNRPWTLFVAASSGSSWATWTHSYDAIESDLYIWNWMSTRSSKVEEDLSTTGEWSRHCALRVGIGEPPSMSRKQDASPIEHDGSGAERPSYDFDSVVKKDLSVSGAIVTGMTDGASTDDLDRLAFTGPDGVDVVFRSPFGDWAHVAVTSVSNPQSRPDRSDASVTQYERQA